MKRRLLFLAAILLLTSCTLARTPPPSTTLIIDPSLSPTASQTPAPTHVPPPSPRPTLPPTPTPVPEAAQNVERTGRLLDGKISVISRNWPTCAGSGAELIVVQSTSPAGQMGHLTLPGVINDIYSDHPYAYVAVEGVGLWIVDVQEQAKPIRVGSFDQPRHPRRLVVDGYCYESCTAGSGHIHAYIASPDEGLYIVDVTDPKAPVLACVYSQVRPIAVAVDRGYAYLADGQGGLTVLDVSDPKSPDEVAFVPTGVALDVTIFEKYAYVAAGPAGLKIVDVSNPIAPVLIDSAYDVSAEFPKGEADSVAVGKGPWFNAGPLFACMTLGDEGILVLDVTDPQSPIAAGFYDTSTRATRIQIRSDTLYAAAEVGGLIELRFVPTPTVTQFGSFALAHLLYTWRSSDTFPAVQLPSWLNVDGERERWFLDRVLSAYAPLVSPERELKDGIEQYYEHFIAAADDYLGMYPEGDGAIPVLMMLGNVHSYQIGWHWGRAEDLLGQEYEKAISLLLRRHPEQVPNILNDLIEMGLPIEQVRSVRLSEDGPEALLFSYHFAPPYGEPKGQVYTLVQQPDESWIFLPLETHYISSWQYGAYIKAADDINGDGRAEIVVRLAHAYADGGGLVVQVFGWQDGDWYSRMVWNPLGRPDEDAFNGSVWLEDQDEDGIQEIVVSYRTGVGRAFPVIDIYQWDPSSGAYTDTRPITVQVCGYHAFAEAERRRALGDWEGALPWYREAQQRLQAELEARNSPCLDHLSEWTVQELLAIAEDPSKIER